MHLTSNIQFFYLQKKVSLVERGRLKRFLRYIFQKEKHPLDELSFIFCSDKHLLNINKEFLGHDYYTDIITFDLSEKSSSSLKAEIYISVDRVRENAKSLGISFKKEIHRVMFHGALHLCGYKDKKAEDRKKMRRMEDKYLELYFQ